MTPEEIDREVYEQAAALRRRGETPRIVELGLAQRDALAAAGKLGLSFTTSEMTGEGPGFRHIGEPYPRAQVRLLTLEVHLVDSRSRISVTP